jgi:hypothetical protein
MNSAEATSTEATHKIRFGRLRGTPITGASDDVLSWYSRRLNENLDDHRLASFQKANRKALAAVQDEQVRRLSLA